MLELRLCDAADDREVGPGGRDRARTLAGPVLDQGPGDSAVPGVPLDRRERVALPALSPQHARQLMLHGQPALVLDSTVYGLQLAIPALRVTGSRTSQISPSPLLRPEMMLLSKRLKAVRKPACT